MRTCPASLPFSQLAPAYRARCLRPPGRQEDKFSIKKLFRRIAFAVKTVLRYITEVLVLLVGVITLFLWWANTLGLLFDMYILRAINVVQNVRETVFLLSRCA